MSITINLTPAEEARLLTEALQNGIAPADLVTKLLREHLGTGAAASSSETWDDESPLSDEELEAERRLFEQFEAGINASRKAAGMRTL